MTPKAATNYNKTVLDNGIRVVTDRIDAVRSAAIGIWFETGARDENDNQRGLSHFIEHMMFKGTKKRTSLEIAQAIEEVGGFSNAFTSKEITAYHCHLLDEHIPLAADVLTDQITNSLFDPEEIKREQKVVIEEIASSDDSPDEVVSDDFSKQIFPDHSLGLPVLGTRDSVALFTHDDIKEYLKSQYTGDRCVVSAAGNIKHDEIVKLVKDNLTLSGAKKVGRENPKPEFKSDLTFERKKDIVQAHMIMGGRGIEFGHQQRFAYFVMNTVLGGGGMSNRLFQTVREQHGLVYNIYSFNETYSDSGCFIIYAAVDAENIEKTTDLVREEIRKIKEIPLTAEELQRAKNQLKGSLVLSLENTNSRMHRLARTELYLQRYVGIDELIDLIDRVTAEDVLEVAHILFEKDLYRSVVIPNS